MIDNMEVDKMTLHQSKHLGSNVFVRFEASWDIIFQIQFWNREKGLKCFFKSIKNNLMTSRHFSVFFQNILKFLFLGESQK